MNKVNDLDRKNLIRITITNKGKKAYRQVAKREAIHSLMSCLSQEERQQLKATLEKLWNSAVEELGANGKTPFIFSGD